MRPQVFTTARPGRRHPIAAGTVVAAVLLVGCGAASTQALAPASADAATVAKTTTPPPRPPRQTPSRQARADARVVQQRLAALGYLPAKAVTGRWDTRTAHAVLAFQAWEGLTRDGIVGPWTLAALETAKRPTPANRVRDRYVEVHRKKGVTLVVERGRVVRALHSSSGAGSNATPAGSYWIFRKELNSWSVPYR